MGRRPIGLAWLSLVVGALLYLFAVGFLRSATRPSLVQEMQVALPRFVQVAVTMGDRYLAANIATWRSLVASTEKMRPDNYAVQGRVQMDAAWLNPRQEDNYYVAAAILPWYGELDAAQYVLAAADRGRPFDWWPMFYYAFNIYYFRHDAVSAANLLRQLASRATLEDDRYSLDSIAASWYQKGYQPEVAVRVINNMAATARSSGFRKFLQMRSDRLQLLLQLRAAATRFEEVHGRRLNSLNELVAAGLLSRLPEDPWHIGFDVDASGVPMFRNEIGKGKP